MATKFTAHTALMMIIGQVVFVIILSEAADFNDSLGRVIVVFIMGLWMVYLINSGPDLFNRLNGKVGL